MVSGRLLVNGNDFYVGNSSSQKVQIARIDQIPSVTLYVHPTTKQCNYSYTHPSSRQCSIPVASSSSDGLMSASDKSKLDSISGSLSALTLIGTRSVTKQVVSSKLTSIGGFLSEEQRNLLLSQYHILIINISGVADADGGTIGNTTLYACPGSSNNIKFFNRVIQEYKDLWFNSSIIVLKETDSWTVPGNVSMSIGQNDIDNLQLFSDESTNSTREWRLTHSIYGI